MSLINKLPSFYNNDITKPIQDSFTVETNSINDEVDNILNQFYVDSATYGLDYWERMLGISKNNFDIDTRRENIKAKIRARGTTTIPVIKNICEAYSNGIVEIIVNHSDYSFIIDFVSTVGVPKGFTELDKIIEEIKPCHLAHSYKFNYNTHRQLTKYTHEQLSNYTHEQLRNDGSLRGNGDTSIPSISILPSTDLINIEEGETGSFTVCLDNPPIVNQVVNVNKDNDNVILDKTSLTFTSLNYNVPQVVNIETLKDDDFSDETCIITLSSEKILSETIVVNIIDKTELIKVTGITVSDWDVKLKVGQSKQLTYSVIPSNATNKLINWYSNDTSVATVSNGLIVAKGIGYSKVTATTDDGGFSYDVHVNVSENV